MDDLEALETGFAAPAFCCVTATLAPSSDSAIRIQVWLPASGRTPVGGTIPPVHMHYAA